MSPRRRDPYNQESTVGLEMVGGVFLGGALGAGFASYLGAESTGVALAAVGGVVLGIALAFFATAAKIRG